MWKALAVSRLNKAVRREDVFYRVLTYTFESRRFQLLIVEYTAGKILFLIARLSKVYKINQSIGLSIYLLISVNLFSIIMIMMNRLYWTSWQARYFRNDWLTEYCDISNVPTPLFFHESRHGPIQALNTIITYLPGCHNHRRVRQHLPTCSGFSSERKNL